jgi:hypothetical protein
MKIMLATASVLTAATLVACGGGSSGTSGHSQTWQDGYDTGVNSNQDPEMHMTDGMCKSMALVDITAPVDEKDEWIAGCIEGIKQRQ